jgi:hypothetical protein
MPLARIRKVLWLGCGATLAAVGAGGCLPQNFYADLAGNVFSSAVLAIVDAAIQQLLATPA